MGEEVLQSSTVGDLKLFMYEESWFKKVIFIVQPKVNNLKNQLMSKALTKQVQNKISRYFLKLEGEITKPKARCIREMTTRTRFNRWIEKLQSI